MDPSLQIGEDVDQVWRAAHGSLTANKKREAT